MESWVDQISATTIQRFMYDQNGVKYTVCPDCGYLLLNGDYPFCPHGRYNQQFTIKQGQPQHAYYYRNHDGTIGIPTSIDEAPPGVTLERIDSIRTAERLQKEMSQELYDKFQDHGQFTEFMDSALGDPISTLHTQATHPKSQLEKDTIPLLIKELETLGSERTKIETDVKFDFLGK